MSDAAQTELQDGTAITVRPITPADRDALLTGFERLSDRSRYLRFFAPRNSLNERELRYLTDVDHHSHEAVIGFEHETGEPIGVARYVQLGEIPRAEVAVTVVDSWQHRGVASALLRVLVDRARQEGIEHFVAVMLDENKAAVNLFRNLTDEEPESWRSEDGHLELLIELPEDGDEMSESLLGRTLRLAARGKVEIAPWRLLKARLRDRDTEE